MEGPVKLRDRQNIDRGIHEEALSALHARGQYLYRQKQYEAALRSFTEVRTRRQLSISTESTLLGHQSGCKGSYLRP